MKIPRAPRSKKRIACELTIDGDRYKGIVLDVAIFGLFVQTNARPKPGMTVEVTMSVSGHGTPVTIETTVARRNVVPPQLLAVAKGGVGLAIEEPPEAYVAFVSEMSAEQSQFIQEQRGRGAIKAGRSWAGSKKANEGRDSAGPGGGAPPPKRFRIHAVESKSGEKNTFLTISVNEEDATAKVLEELGGEWQVLFVERA